MPIFIPIVLGTLAVSAMGWGTKKGVDGVHDIRQAKQIAEAAQRKLDRNKRVVEESRQSVNADAHAFGIFKLEVARDTLGGMVKLLDELQRRGRLTSLETLEGVDFAPEALVATMREPSGTATSVLAGVVFGAVKGSLTGAALYGLAGSIGVASTGAAISGLAGAAAQSATLAWLGGGALAAGGFGMFGGMVVLSGIAAAPVFLITGYTLASKGAEAMTEATRFASEVKVAVENMHAMNEALKQMRVRIAELTEVIAALRERATNCIQAIWRIADVYDEHDRRHSSMLTTAMNLCKDLSELMKTPVIVGEEGKPNPMIPTLIARYRTLTP